MSVVRWPPKSRLVGRSGSKKIALCASGVSGLIFAPSGLRLQSGFAASHERKIVARIRFFSRLRAYSSVVVVSPSGVPSDASSSGPSGIASGVSATTKASM